MTTTAMKHTPSPKKQLMTATFEQNSLIGHWKATGARVDGACILLQGQVEHFLDVPKTGDWLLEVTLHLRKPKDANALKVEYEFPRGSSPVSWIEGEEIDCGAAIDYWFRQRLPSRKSGRRVGWIVAQWVER